LPFAFYPEDEKLAASIPPTAEKLKESTLRLERLAADESAQRARLTDAEAEYARLKKAADSRLHWLRTCQWQTMPGRNFANFLELAFEEHGYTVEPGHRADEWRNVLVLRRGDKRLAVHARGGPDKPVDVDAVEQARSAMGTHNCRSAAVVTNSRFTAPARELAERINCKLVDSSQIADLIEGRIAL
jgi:HJR/Mrr/RecB family endonuclease